MRMFRQAATLLGLLVTLSTATALRAQTNFSIKIYAADGSGWTDSVTIGKYTTATGGITDSVAPALVEKELPPLPPGGASQAPDLRIVDPLGGGAYGQGVRVDLRQLTYDAQKNTYRLSFRRGDPDGSGITLSWQTGLETVSGGGFFLTDGFGGLIFAPVDMAAQQSFSHASWTSLSGGIVDIVIGDGSMHRTFTADSIALDTDAKGKTGKYEKAKPISVDFQITLNSPLGGADNLYIEFDKVVEGTVSFPGDPDSHLPINISGLKKYTLPIPPPMLDTAGVTVVITGNGNKGKIMKGKYGFTLAGSKLVKTAFGAFDYQYLRLPMPNVNNIGDEIYLNPGNLSLGMGPGLGLPAQIGVNAKGKPIIHHISIPKWKDVFKTMYKFKNVTILQNGPAYCLDTINSKENLKALKALAPDKTVRYKGSTQVGNKLIGQLMALKFNMAISEFGHTPTTGFRDLVYTGGGPFDGQTVDVIADSADKALACYGGLPGGWSYQDMADFLETINMEFSGAWDTASWSGVKTVVTGVKAVALSSILANSGAAMTPAAPMDYSAFYQVPQTFSLSQNYPNPFNPTTTIEFSIPEDAIVSLTVYNLLGQAVATLADREEFSAGENWVELDGAKLSSGVYYYRIVVNDGQFQDVRKMVLMK